MSWIAVELTALREEGVKNIMIANVIVIGEVID